MLTHRVNDLSKRVDVFIQLCRRSDGSLPVLRFHLPTANNFLTSFLLNLLFGDTGHEEDPNQTFRVHAH